ncbi:transcriptional regulator [Streptomyces sulfonofaciens]|uniref:Transcriptional regulator n=1 Tax=Streptomyces sulfonofaciens TaxID=68272 RepID=A0A919FWD2_9ACTN|nr:GntR family transcriptional regulator [Streptomyces sulfonofaciens]GHH73718.1 transcriptional regulator [Streptomyces sulfonofaciens]
MNSVPTPIPSRTQFVLEGIKHRILTGLLSPGQALVESELAAQFGVSKTPVREALKTLAGTGLVVMSQYKGVTVRRVDADMAREVYDVRLLLEPEALRRTVCRGASLEAAREALESADGAGDTAERSLANRAFHRALYTPCGNPLLARMLDEVRDQAALVSAVAWAAQPSWDREAAEHREILRLALAGDAQGAAGALHCHIASFVARAYPRASAAPAGTAGTPGTTGASGTTGVPGARTTAGAAEGGILA